MTAGGVTMKADFPGLLIERHRSGNPRYRVRVEGDKTRRIPIPVGPDHEDFSAHYKAARRGRKMGEPGEKALPAAKGSLQWLVDQYTAHLVREVEAGLKSNMTLKQRRAILKKLADRYGTNPMLMRRKSVVNLRDSMMHKPGAADNAVKAVKAMYSWACEREIVSENPAEGVAKIGKEGGGAVSWTVAHLRQYLSCHQPGTMAHTYLTLLVFTACRISDAIWIGRDNEIERDGALWLEWQPRKANSRFVSIPMLPPLIEATRDATGAYITSQTGRPFKSTEALRMRMRRWCDAAGLENLSSHGVRKAAAAIMSENGASQQAIMAVQSHASPRTSQIYTEAADRARLGKLGVEALRIDW